MKKRFFFVITALICLLFFGTLTAAENPADTILSLELDTPENQEHRSYLGLADSKTFRITDISCKILVVEIFSMYCPHCQREAPNLNAFYQLVTSDPTLSEAVKIIGVGVGNSAFEVNYFRKTYDIPFPLFPDKDFLIHKALGEVRTPYFIGVKMKSGGAAEVFLSEAGPRGTPGAFLRALMEKSNLK